MSNSVNIIGAGPGGLATAMLLAAKGMSVRIFERLSGPGGRTQCFGEKGYRFDLGPTFFLYPQILKEIYQTAGFDLDKEVPMARLDPQYRILFGSGGKLDATPNLELMAQRIGEISAQDAPGFARFIEENRAKLTAFEPFLETPYLNWKDLLDPRAIKVAPFLRPHQSVDDYLKRFFADPRIRLAFSFQSKYLGMSPFKCPSLFSILSFLEYEHGVFHPIGGCGAVSENMADRVKDLGGEIFYNAEVEQIHFEGRRASGVVVDGKVHKADSLVINADFARAMTKLVPNHLRSRWTDEKIAKKRFSCSTFMLYLGVEGQFDLPHHNIFISGDYERNLREIEDLHQLSADPSVYIQNACVTDPGMAPEGHSTLYILAPVTHKTDNLNWSQEAPAFRDKVLQQISKIGFGDIEGRIRYERTVTPDDWENGYEIYKGATFNLAHNLGQMLHFRPGNRFQDLEGVYLTGGGTHPGSGLPVIFESAKITSRLLIQDMGLHAA